MPMIKNRHRNIIQICFVLFCVVTMLFFYWFQSKYDKENDVVSDISIKVLNEKLHISWVVPSKTKIENIKIDIDDNGKTIKSISVASNKEIYEIDNLETNKKYLLIISAIYEDGSLKEVERKDYLYYDEESLPDLPTFYIDTKTGLDPTTSYMESPFASTGWGGTSYDNEYLKATMEYRAFGKKIESKLKIRARGNTSSLDDKKPYKIVLDNPLDLTNSGSDYSHKKWILLNTGETLDDYLGEVISKEVGVEWVTHGIYVNLILNGDYKGIYTLVEPVGQDTSRGLVSKNGIIFENDAFFWNSNWCYFKLYGQIDEMGYTFKYPNIESSDDERIFEVYKYMQKFVDLLTCNDENAWDYGDLDNFVSYMIAKDLTVNGDAGGTNIYYYIEDFYSDNQGKRKIKIGPLWDFETLADINMNGEKYINSAYSSQHDVTYLPFVDNEEFKEAYWEKWEELSGDILDKIYTSLDELCSEQGDAINQSRYLNSLRWSDGSYQTLEDEVDLAKVWLIKQVEFLNEEMENR